MDAGSTRYVLVVGNIGTGKTGLAGALAKATDSRPLLESVDENPFFARFYTEPGRWAFASQVCFAAERLRDQVRTLGAGNVVQDRSVFEAVDVFSRVLHEDGHLSAEELEVLCELRRCAQGLPRQPTHLVYLHAPTPTLMERIAGRGREPERRITDGYLERLAVAYERFVAAWDACPVITVDSAAVDLREEANVSEITARMFHE